MGVSIYPLAQLDPQLTRSSYPALLVLDGVQEAATPELVSRQV